MKKTLLLLFGPILFFSFDSFGQCEDIVVTFPNGQCTAFARVLAHTNISRGGFFTLMEFVNGTWQDVMTLPNEDPPVRFDVALTQTSEYVVDYAYAGVCSSTSSVFTLTLPPPTPSVPGIHHVCFGESATFTVENPSGANYRWYEGTTLVAEGPGTQFNTGPLTSSKNYSVSAVSGEGCESAKTGMSVTVHNPSPPTPFNLTRCRPETNVTLSASGGFSAYQWYDQNNAVLGTTATNSLTLSNPALTSYKLKVQDGWECWSANMSAAATVTTTHDQGPAVWQQSGCTSVTMIASYTGNGSYQIEWYTTETGGTPEYSDVIPHAESQVSYSPNLSSPKTYWVGVYDFYSDCRTPRTQITVTPPTARYVWGNGQSCESGMVTIQAQGSNVTTYSLYYHDGQNYIFIGQNNTGTFEYDNFESDDLNYTSNYYLKGSGGGCQTTGYTQVNIQVLRPSLPGISGNVNPCYGASTVLTASGGSEGSYRWYRNGSQVSGQNGSQFPTGNLTANTEYEVSYVIQGSIGQCESPKRYVPVTVRNPAAPTPFPANRCNSETTVTLSATNGYAGYQWYDQNNTLLGTTGMNSLNLTNPGLTSYKLKVQDSWGCWSTNLSAAATVTTTHAQGPAVWQQSNCTSVTMTASYTGDGSYDVEWYTTATGGTPEYSDVIPHAESQVSYSPNLSGPKTYWVEAHDFITDCRTPRTQITVTPPPARYVSGTGQSCESGMVSIQAQGSNVSTYSLYYFDGQNYNFISQNSTGTFEYDNFESDDLNYTSNYYLKGSGGGCQTVGYTQVNIQVLRPSLPGISGNVNPCYDTGTILTASGGSEGSYRWYQNSDPNPVSGQNGSQFPTGNLTAPTVYEVSYIVQGLNGQCESPKRLVNVGITPSSSVTGFSVSPGTEFYGTVSPALTLSHVGHVGQVTYESSINGTAWSATISNPTVDQPMTYFHAKAVNGDCPPAYSSPIIVSLYPLPVITIAEEVNYLTYGNALHLTTGTYYSYQWIKDGQDIAGANQRTFMVTEPGAYTLRVKGSSTSQQVASEIVTIYDDAVESQNLNYISTITLLDKQLNPAALHTLEPDQYSQSTTYFDGLGRPMQNVVTKGSPQADDVIQPIVYDEFGRERRRYLPFVNPDRNAGLYADNGLIIGADNGYDYIGDAASFYDSPETKVADDDGDRPYAETVFEPSPLNRVIERGAAGAVWQPGTGRTIKMAYETNDANEVRLWTYAYPSAEHPLGLVESQGPYGVNELFRNVTTDEHGNDVIEYVDKEGKTVLKRVQAVDDEPNSVAPAINDTNYASTYYIYDDLGNLVCVIQPEGVKNIASYFSADGPGKEAFLQKWAFRYRYDGKKRMIIKQVPGADSVVMVYDSRDRLVLTQDGNQRSENQWNFTKYDALNRPVITGIYTDANDRDDMQIDVNNYYENLTSGQAWYDSYIGSASGSVFGYDNKSFPQGNIARYLTVTYYDTYDSFVAPAGYSYQSQGLPGEEVEEHTFAKGQVTGTLVKDLTTDAWMRTVSYYDDKYRLIQSISDHHKNGTVRSSTVYDFVGKPLHAKRTYNVNGVETVITEEHVYDHTGRMQETRHQVGNDPHDKVLLVRNEYNALGQLVTKNLHKTGQSAPYVTADPAVGQPGVRYGDIITSPPHNSSEHTYIATTRIKLQNGFHIPGGNTFRARIGYSQQDAEARNNAVEEYFAQQVDYRYNIRGWLKQINDPANPSQDDLFNMALAYNTPSANGGEAQFNGNISEAVWKTIGMDDQSYGYSYDPMNRLLNGRYYNPGNPLANGRFNEEIGVPTEEMRPAYDLNGNIRNLRRYGAKTSTNYGLMDDLTYDYNSNGNKLIAVTDAVATHAEERGFREIVETSADYQYDDNGNMKVDENKGINAIVYNYLNLPSEVHKGASDYIAYTYDATGKKLAQKVFGSTSKTTDYIGELVYEDSVLQFISHSEGRVVMTGGVDYQYFLKDHLGNVRLTFATKGETESVLATNEPSNESHELANFLRLQHARHVTATLFDRTNGASTGTSVRLNGGANERYGLARSIAVMPGDVINTEVYAKYVENDPGNWTEALVNLMSAIANNTGGIVVDGSQYSQSTSSFPHPGTLGSTGTNGAAPKVYLNWIVFDGDMAVQSQSGYTRISIAARETGTDIAHERLFNPVPITITKPGYVYIYFSNENETSVEVFFDDFKIEHIKSPVVQMDDYYPFGLTFNSYRGENNAPNFSEYNGKEKQDELDLGWLDYGARMYMPDIGRWGVIDPLSDLFASTSPYAYALNNPSTFNDIEGLLPGDPKYKGSGKVVIILSDNPREVWNTSTLDNTSWDYGVFGSMHEAAAWMAATYKKDGVSVQNLVIRTHGYVPLNEEGSTELSVPSGDLSNPNELSHEDLDAGTDRDVVALSKIGESLGENANVLFTACNACMNTDKLPEAIFRVLKGKSKNLSVFTNGATTKLHYSKDFKVKVRKSLNGGLTSRYLYAPWKETTSSGTKSMGRNVTPGLNTNGTFMWFYTSPGGGSSVVRRVRRTASPYHPHKFRGKE